MPYCTRKRYQLDVCASLPSWFCRENSRQPGTMIGHSFRNRDISKLEFFLLARTTKIESCPNSLETSCLSCPNQSYVKSLCHVAEIAKWANHEITREEYSHAREEEGKKGKDSTRVRFARFIIPEKNKERRGGVGILPIMAFKGRLRPKGTFSGFRYIKM